MRSFVVVAAVLSAALLQPASAVTGQALAWRDSPSGGRFVGPVWVTSCPSGQRLTGIRVHEDKRIAGLQAFCTQPSAGNEVSWAGKPRLVPPPRTKKAKEDVAYVDDEGRRLSDYGTGMLRDGEADRVVIMEEADWPSEDEGLGYSPVGYDTPGPDAVALTEDAVYRPDQDIDMAGRPKLEESSFETSYARATWANTPYLWRYTSGVYRGAVKFKKVRGSYDLTCPRDTYVTGVRTGWRTRKGAGSQSLSEIRLVCGRPNRHDQTLVSLGDDGKPKNASLRVERSECRGVSTNPFDGDSVQSIFGAIEDGRVQTIGVSCVRWEDGRPSTVAAVSP